MSAVQLRERTRLAIDAYTGRESHEACLVRLRIMPRDQYYTLRARCRALEHEAKIRPNFQTIGSANDAARARQIRSALTPAVDVLEAKRLRAWAALSGALARVLAAGKLLREARVLARAVRR